LRWRRGAAWLGLLLLSAIPVPAEDGAGFFADPPTLVGLGAAWSSANGGVQLNLSGRLLLEGYFPDDHPAWLINETEAFAAGELSLFSDLFLGEHLLVVNELRLDRGETPTADEWDPRIEQLFLRYTPWLEHQAYLQLGRFVSPFGAYPQRHDTPADPFIRPPLPYEFRTMICPSLAPGSNDGFIYWRDVPERFRSMGAPVIWNSPYQIGAMVAAAGGPVSARLAMMNSAPSSPPDDWNYVPGDHYDPSWVAHLSYRVLPELSVGVSYNIGPYSETEIEETLPEGTSINDFDQEIWGFELNFTSGWTELRGEVFLDRWEVPNVIDDPEDVSYYLELKRKLSTSVWVAARYGGIHFRRIAESDGELDLWDYDVQRWQVAVGYRINRAMEVRAEMMWNDIDSPVEEVGDLLSLQLRWAF
jgi:hypothetical protein